ncbi:MAG: hypothetical protein WA659_04405 [Candidatus Aquirickettsiella sp.]
MQEDQVSVNNLIAMVNAFSGCSIDPKYFLVIFKSPIILESLNCIYQHNRKANLKAEDIQKIRQVFKNYFSFFAEQNIDKKNQKYSKKYLILTGVFFLLSLLSGIGCFYFPTIFAPLVFIFSGCLIACTCLINIKTYPIQITEVQDNFRKELNDLKYNLLQLEDLLNNTYTYPIKTTYNFFGRLVASLDSNTAKTSRTSKKTVSFAPSKVKFFFQESDEFRSRSNSNENGHFQHKG